MDRVEQLLSNETILEYAKNRERKPYFGEFLFPEKKIHGLTLDYIKGANNLPVAANIHGFDTEAEIGERDTFSIVKEKLALVKRKIKMDEELLIKLNSKNDHEFEEAVKKLYDDIDNMVESVRARAEHMRMQALSTGKISTEGHNRARVVVDYKVPDNHKEVLTTSWADDASKPLDDIKRWSDIILMDTGVRPTRALTSTTVLNSILVNKSVRKAMYGVNSDMILTEAQLNQQLKAMGLPSIVTYDEMYRVETLDKSGYKTERFFPEDTFVMFGPDILGHTVYGLTGEEIELRSSENIDKSMFGNIVALVYRTIDPVARWTKAAATVLPSFPAANEVFIAKVG